MLRTSAQPDSCVMSAGNEGNMHCSRLMHAVCALPGGGGGSREADTAAGAGSAGVQQ